MPRGWRDLQATNLVGSVRRALAPGQAQDGLDRGVVPWRGRSLPPVPASGGTGPEVAAAVRARAVAAGLPEAAAAALEERWPMLLASARRQVAAPLRPPRGGRHVLWGTEVAVQTDATTCGSAVLAMLAAAGDPGLALWLATGEELPGYAPPEVRFLRRIRPGALPLSPQRRFAALQRAVKHVTNQLGPLPWPYSLGTPPWGAARAARFGPVRYRAEMVDDADRRRTSAQLARAAGALEAGIPVPLYTGGDLSTGLATAASRHVVLLTSHQDGVLTVYEPGHGLLTTVTGDELLVPRGPHRALGGWTHATWIVLPCRAGEREDGI